MDNFDDFDDDIIWDSSEDDNKRQNKRPRQPKNSKPESEIPAEQPRKQARPVSQRSSQAQAQSFSRAEQIRERRARSYRPVSIWEGFENAFMASYRHRVYRYRSRLRFAQLMFVFVSFFLFFAFDGMSVISRRWTSPVRSLQERVQQRNTQAQQRTSTQTSRATRENRVLYLKNFSVISQVILLLQAEGRYCSFTSLGLANCFATQLNVSKQSGNVLHLVDGATYIFDCEDQKCTLNVDLDSNVTEVMSIPLSADADGNIVINRKDVERFLND